MGFYCNQKSTFYTIAIINVPLKWRYACGILENCKLHIGTEFAEIPADDIEEVIEILFSWKTFANFSRPSRAIKLLMNHR